MFLKLRRRTIIIAKKVSTLLLSVMAIVYIFESANKIGMTDFVKSYTHATTLFEDYYVSPADVELVFPEEKKNLLLIYLESMETTYMSTDVGGGKGINYIPELLSEQGSSDHINHRSM